MNKKPLFGYSLLFYPLFYMKIDICFLYKGVSYLGEPAVYQIGGKEELQPSQRYGPLSSSGISRVSDG